MANPFPPLAPPLIPPLARAEAFCAKYGLQLPILLAPMAGACPVSLSVALANAGSMGALGALMSTPEAIRNWVQQFRSKSSGPLQINTWIPDPPPLRDAASEARMRAFRSEERRVGKECRSR